MHAHRQNLAKHYSSPPSYQPYHVDYQGPPHSPLGQGRFQAFLRQQQQQQQQQGYAHPPSTHTPAPLPLQPQTPSSSAGPSSAISSPAGSPHSPHPHSQANTHGGPPPPPSPLYQLPATLPPPTGMHHPTADEEGAASADPDRPRPIYDFPDAVVMTEQIRQTRDINYNRMLNQYMLGHRLGRGQHGDVYKGFDVTRDYMVVAIKACRRKGKDRMEELRAKNAMERAAAAAAAGASGEGRGLQRVGVGGAHHLVDRLQSAERKVLREIAIMKKCKHGQIVQLLEVIDDRLTSKIFMVMEYMGGGEIKWRDTRSEPVLRVDQARRICRDVVLGLEYLHHQGIIHRDIKPANLLWTADRRGVKITDFGVSHFSYAQRLKSVRASEAYRRAAERKKARIEKARIEKERVEREAREKAERAQHWRFQGKGRNKAAPGGSRSASGSGSGSAGSSGRATPGLGTSSTPTLEKEREKEKAAGDDADDADDADILASLQETPDPLLLDDGGLSRQAGTPSFLAPELVWEFRREVVRRFGSGGGGGGGRAGAADSTRATVGTSGNPFGPGFFGGTSEVGGDEGGTGGSMLATHPAHSHSPSPARSRSASNPLPDNDTGQGENVHSTVVNVIPPSEPSTHGDEPGPSPSLSPSPSSRDSPNTTTTSPSPTNTDTNTNTDTDTNSNGHGTVTATTTTANAPTHPSSSIITGTEAGHWHTNASVDPDPDPDPDFDGDTQALLDAPRPPVTKAIDVWALGVTLYCLLFACCPWTGPNEFVLFQAVHAQEFVIPETMGYDRLPTGGRRWGKELTKEEEEGEEGEGEGAVVVWLLERLLEKDVERRITLDEVKRLPWITRDIPDPEAWLRETSPQRHDPINVTAADESDAMSTLKFTWRKRELRPAAQRGGGGSFGRLRQAGGRVLRNLLPGRRGAGAGARQMEALEDAEESDGAHTDAGLGVGTSAGASQGWMAGWRSKSRLDLSLGSKNKGKGKEREREVERGEGEPSGMRRTPSRRRRFAQATADAVERVTRSGSMRGTTRTSSAKKRGKLPELKLNTSRSRDSSLSRPGSRAQTPDVRRSASVSAAQFYLSSPPPRSAYQMADEPGAAGGPPTPRARAGSTSALTSPSTADLSSDDIFDEDDEHALEEREKKERARLAQEKARAEDERVSRRSSIQKFLPFGRQCSSRSSLTEQNKKAVEQGKKGKQRSRTATAGTASGSGSDAGSRTALKKGLVRRSEDNMRFLGTTQKAGPSSSANTTATSGIGPRSGSGPALSSGAAGMGMGLAAGGTYDAPLSSGDLTNAMRASSWEGSGSAYPSRDFDVISDCDNQSVVFVDEDTRMIGAGGIWSHPGTLPGSPASQSHSRSGGSLSQQIPADGFFLPEPVAPAYGHVHAIPLIHPQGEHLLQAPNVPVVADPALQEGTGYNTVRPANVFSSPLAQTPLNNYEEPPFDEEYIRSHQGVEQLIHQARQRSVSRDVRRRRRTEDPHYVRYGEDDENSSFESGERVYGKGQTTLQDEVEEEEYSDSEEAEEAIVVRRRRPSESLARSKSRVRPDDE